MGGERIDGIKVESLGIRCGRVYLHPLALSAGSQVVFQLLGCSSAAATEVVIGDLHT